MTAPCRIAGTGGASSMKPALQILAALVCLGTFLPLVRSESWIVRGWDFPKLQLLAAAVFSGAGLLWFGVGTPLDLLLWIATAVAGSYLLFRIWPYQPFARKQVGDADEERALRLMISNVLMTNRESERLVDQVRELQPDVLIALETDAWWAERLAELDDLLPHAVEVPQDDTYGLVLRSAVPLVEPEVRFLVNRNIPSVRGKFRLGTGATVRFHALHPKPPFPDEDDSSTDRDIELIVVAEEIRETGGPTLVFGDMNDVAWSPTTRLFRRISGMLDPRIGRGLFSTFHAGHCWMRWPLDHVFVSSGFRVRELRRLPSVGSDHFPILVDLAHEPWREDPGAAPEPTPAEKEIRDGLLERQPAHPR